MVEGSLTTVTVAVARARWLKFRTVISPLSRGLLFLARAICAGCAVFLILSD